MSLEERFTITLTEEEWKALNKELKAAEQAVKDAKHSWNWRHTDEALGNLTSAMENVLNIILLLTKKRD